MLILIAILLIVADTGIVITMLMIASLVSKLTKTPTIEQAQADFFKAWGDDIIAKTSK